MNDHVKKMNFELINLFNENELISILIKYYLSIEDELLKIDKISFIIPDLYEGNKHITDLTLFKMYDFKLIQVGTILRGDKLCFSFSDGIHNGIYESHSISMRYINIEYFHDWIKSNFNDFVKICLNIQINRNILENKIKNDKMEKYLSILNTD